MWTMKADVQTEVEQGNVHGWDCSRKDDRGLKNLGQCEMPLEPGWWSKNYQNTRALVVLHKRQEKV